MWENRGEGKEVGNVIGASGWQGWGGRRLGGGGGWGVTCGPGPLFLTEEMQTRPKGAPG